MTTKLNLTIKEENAKYMKVYAKKHKTSVSKIADAYFSSLVNEDETQYKKKKSFVEKYAGILKDIHIGDIDKARDEYLKEKYGV
jgi:hypothetical protein